MADEKLDARGLTCPLPVLKARKALQSLDAGQIIEVLATDPGALEDFPAFCGSAGHELLEARMSEAGHYCFVIRKAGN